MPRQKLRRYFRHGMLPQLIVFEAVARLGSVTRAAESLHLAQPTVSTQLRKLADGLEVRLFEPRGRGLQLTAAGHELHESCRDLLDVMMRMEERMAAWRGTPPPGSGCAADHLGARALAVRINRDLAAAAALFLRDALRLDAAPRPANNPAAGWTQGRVANGNPA